MTHRDYLRTSGLFVLTLVLGTFSATAQPVISNVVVSDTTQHTVTVSWDTDVAATALVELAFVGKAFEFTFEDATLNTSHSFVLDLFEVNAKPQSDYRMMSGTSYDFRIAAIDAADDTTFDATRNVTTTSFGGGA